MDAVVWNVVSKCTEDKKARWLSIQKLRTLHHHIFRVGCLLGLDRGDVEIGAEIERCRDLCNNWCSQFEREPVHASLIGGVLNILRQCLGSSPRLERVARQVACV